MTKAEKIQRLNEIKRDARKIREDRLPEDKFQIWLDDAQKAVENVYEDAQALIDEMLQLTHEILSEDFKQEDVDVEGDLTEAQLDLAFAVNKMHIECNGSARQPFMKIIKVWLDDRGTVCVRLLNGEWYHYYDNGTWG